MKSNDYHEIVCKALEIARSDLSNNLSIAEVAKRVGYSHSRLRGIFQKTTGRSLVEHVVDLRIEEAKRLLTQTNLKIAEIAFEVGFGGHEHFTRTFREKTGFAPSQFRNANYESTEKATQEIPAEGTGAREWFSQNFAGEDQSKDFELREGSFEQKDGYALGSAPESFGLFFLRPLPENVEISLEIRALSASNGGPSHAVITFSDKSFSVPWYQITLGEHDFTTCILKQLGVHRRVYTNPPIRPDEWQSVRVRLVDDRLSVFLDNENLFEFQNDFPPLYNQRCRFRFGTYQSPIHFRRLRITDLGIPALMRSIRQGDALYNTKSYDAAREFYSRILETKAAPKEFAELEYKIGMCFSSQGALSQARIWLDRSISMNADGFWAQQAKIYSLRLDILEQNPAAIERARQFLKDPKMADETRNALEEICRQLWDKGDFDRVVGLQKLIMENSNQGGLLYCRALAKIAEAQEWLLETDQSERLLNVLLGNQATPKDVRTQALRELGYVYHVTGKLALSKDCYAKLALNTADASKLADRDIYHAFVLRAEDKITGALDLLDDVAGRPGIPYRAGWAKLESSLILCGIHEVEKARGALEKAKELCPGLSYLQPGYVSLYSYVPELMAEDFARASDLLLADSRAQDSMILMHGLQAMLAGFIMEIAHDKKESRKIWAEMLRRFPLQRCSHFAPLAERLLNGEIPNLDRIPLGNQWVSELHYLAALACEAKGDHARGKTLLERCLQLDGSLRWPAYLAQKKLEVQRMSMRG